jgi:NAD+ synthase (glutamine-hydrolysing)
MKIALAQLNYKVGDLKGNTDKNIGIIKRAYADNVDLVIFPELCITGYPPHDLVENPSFIKAVEKQDERMEAEVIGLGRLNNFKHELSVLYGNVVSREGLSGRKLENSAILLDNDGIGKEFQKQLLPTYGIFDEWRNFEPGKKTGTFTLDGKTFGVLICEDIWAELDNLYENNPVEKLFRVNKKVDCIISINASPSNEGKVEQRKHLLEYISNKYDTPIIYVNQVGANDDMIFDGNSMIVSPQESSSQAFTVGKAFQEDYITFNFGDDFYSILTSYDYENDVKYRSNVALNYEHIVLGIRDYVIKSGFPGVVVGCSGGIDSALVLGLAVDALGPDKVTAITMPSKYSSDGSVSDSKILCDNLGIKLLNTNIEADVIGYRLSYLAMGTGELKGIAEENIQARIRGNILMAYSNAAGVLVLSTSNKSEASVGYTTLYGDMSGGLAPISDLYKTEVWALSEYYNQLHGKEVIPNIIIHKAPSAELRPDQKDTDSLPPYEVLDKILIGYIENGILTSGPDAFRIYDLVDKSEFKRRQAPPTIRVHKIAFGAGRKLPIVKGNWR